MICIIISAYLPADEVDDDDDDVIGGDVISVVDDVVDGASAGEGEGGSGCVEVAAGAGLALAGGSVYYSTAVMMLLRTTLVAPHLPWSQIPTPGIINDTDTSSQYWETVHKTTELYTKCYI
jgi:hypothetical protein